MLGKALVKRGDAVGPNANRVHLIGAAGSARWWPRELAHDHVKELVRKDLIHRAKLAAQRLTAMEIDVPDARLSLALEPESEARKPALRVREQQIRRLDWCAIPSREILLFPAKQPQ